DTHALRIVKKGEPPLLTPEELETIADKIESAVGIPPNPIRFITMKEVAKAQRKPCIEYYRGE
ncbi:hypothetical protein LCGC14_2963980, partial [marine sediment metagenome]